MRSPRAPRRQLLRLLPALMAGMLAASACSDSLPSPSALGGDDDQPPTTDLSAEEILLTSGLETVDSCDALLDRIKDEAIERVGPYGFGQGLHPWGGPILMEDAAEGEALATDSVRGAPATTMPAVAQAESSRSAGLDRASGGDGDGFSGTNNQEGGVDEADLVKTDGERLVVVSGNTMRVIDVTANVPRLTKTITLPDDAWGGQLFLHGDRALVMTSGWTDRPFLSRSIPIDWYQGSQIGRLLEIDLERGDVVRTLEFEGTYLSAREIDGSIRIVLTASADRFAFVYPSNDGAEEAATEANKTVIESSTIEQWIPTYRVTEGGETVSEGPIVDCSRVHLPRQFAGFGSMILLTADLDQGLQLNDGLSVFTDAQTMYASLDRVAVATPRWPELNERGEPVDDDGDYTTAIHTFDITDPDRARYAASGSVRGSLLNQYSLSEYQGYLRVATTDGSPWWGGNEQSESYVIVMEEDGGVLQTVGQVGGLGVGEQIFAVRFLGDQGYVVTFRQIDPLYTIDLSDPTNPRVTGELKIPGFSSYLHPVDEDHLLGVGTDGDEDGRTQGAVVSLFDVSDSSDPRRTAKLSLSEAVGLDLDGFEGDTSTPVSWDAKAFTWWDGVAIVPVSWWRYHPVDGSHENGSAAVLIDVDTGGELSTIGVVEHPGTTRCEDGVVIQEAVPGTEPGLDPQPDDDGSGNDGPGSGDAEADFVTTTTLAPESEPGSAPEPGRYCETWTPEIQRSLVIWDNLYTLSEGGVMVTTFDGLDTVTWIPFELR